MFDQSLRAALLFVAALLIPSAEAATLDCPNGIVTATSPDEQQLVTMCQAADAGLAQLSQCDLRTPSFIAISVQSKIHAECLGVFHCGEQKIEILSPKAMNAVRRPDGVFAHLPDDRMFQSVIVHEIAHAAFDETPCPYEQCVASSEYFAYAIQLLELTEAERKSIETASQAKGKVTHDHINAFLLFMSPDTFTVNVWAHLNTRPDICGYLKSIQDGVTLFDRFHP